MVTGGLGSRRGAALFIVLLFSAFLAALAASAMRTGLSGVRAAAVFADGVRADELGQGAAAALAYRLQTGDIAARRGGSIAVRLADADIVIDYLSESARVDANLAPVPLLVALLTSAGADPGEAEAAGERISQFRVDAAARDKRDAAPTSGAAPLGGLAAIQASLESVRPSAGAQTADLPLAIRDTDEIAAAWGIGDDLARRVRPSLTVSNGTPLVDPVLAGRPVVMALLGGDERADDYLQRRRQGFASKDSALDLLPIPARAFATFKDSAAVRALVRVTVAHRLERRYEIVVAPRPRSAPAVAAAARKASGPGVSGLVLGGAAAPPAAAPAPAPPPPTGTGGEPVVVSWRKLI